MSEQHVRPGEQHPPHWRQDLNPDPLAGINLGPLDMPDTSRLRSAYDVKQVHRRLADEFRDDELKQIPLLPRGYRLEQGATYFDLCEGREFVALGNQSVERDDCVVAKSLVDYQLWNRLRGEPNPERTGYADDGSTKTA